jgi:DNA-binding IclR family transcriptional regulator
MNPNHHAGRIDAAPMPNTKPNTKPHAKPHAKSSTTPKSDYSIQTVSNALRMLEAFYGEDELGVSELSRRLGLHKNNVFRLLATLEQSGYIEQSVATDRYRLGTRCLELGQAFSRSHTLLRRSRPILEELVGKVGETAHLGVLRGFEVVQLDGVIADQMIVTALRVGQRLPVHCTAQGKVLIGCGDAALRERFVQQIQGRESLAQRTDATIVDAQKLLDEFGSVAARGFAVDLEECERGMHCVAAPVRDASGAVIASLSVSGLAFRLGEALAYGDAARCVVAAADQLSLELGGPPSSARPA